MSVPPDTYLGEPGHPAPWTTSTPLEGLRDTDAAVIVSLAPDVCKSPNAPVPYPVVEFCGHDEGYTPTVRFTGQRAMVLRSRTGHVHGDEAGRGGGVVSGTCGGICEPMGHAEEVRAEGSPVIRHLDRFWMNDRNTVGEAVFVRDTGVYPAPVEDDPLPGSLRTSSFFVEGAEYQVAQAATGTMTDAAPTREAPRSAGAGAPPRTPSTTGPPLSRLLLRRLGLFGLVLEEEIRRAQQTPTERQQEALARGIAISPAGQVVIRQDQLLGGRSHDPNPLAVFDPATWKGKYGVFAGPDEHVPLGNDILSRLAGRPVRIGELTLEEIDGILSPFAGLNEEEVEAKLAEIKAERERKPSPDDGPPFPFPVPIPPGVRVDEESRRRGCKVGTYRQLTQGPDQCPPGSQAHHIMADYTLRYGNREQGMLGRDRIPNLPGFWDGPSICLQGQAKETDTEHWLAHTADESVAELGRSNVPQNTADLGQVKDLYTEAAVDARRQCETEIRTIMSTGFAASNDAQLVRTRMERPLPRVGTDTHTVLKNGWTHAEFSDWVTEGRPVQ